MTASILAKHCNASGIPALEWCVFKLDAKFYPTPEELEATKWWKDAQRAGNPLYIPVFEPDAYSYTDGELDRVELTDTSAELSKGVRSPLVLCCP